MYLRSLICICKTEFYKYYKYGMTSVSDHFGWSCHPTKLNQFRWLTFALCADHFWVEPGGPHGHGPRTCRALLCAWHLCFRFTTLCFLLSILYVSFVVQRLNLKKQGIDILTYEFQATLLSLTLTCDLWIWSSVLSNLALALQRAHLALPALCDLMERTEQETHNVIEACVLMLRAMMYLLIDIQNELPSRSMMSNPAFAAAFTSFMGTCERAQPWMRRQPERSPARPRVRSPLCTPSPSSVPGTPTETKRPVSGGLGVLAVEDKPPSGNEERGRSRSRSPTPHFWKGL